MATNVLNARLQLRYDTFINWMNSDVILLQGEIAVAAMYNRKTLTLSDAEPENTPPAIGIKVGDGVHYFYELPWLQAVSADVYSWAKASNKPSYTANEIHGLAEYINSHSSSGGNGSSSTSAYRITYNEDDNKYILQQYNDTTEEWEDTESEINFTPVLNRIQAIENWANGGYTNIGNIETPIVAYIQDIVSTLIGRLDVEDNAIAHQFVTSVSENNGKITVTRAGITSEDISGVFSTAKGGTGFSNVDENEILVGSQTGQLKKTNVAVILDVTDKSAIPTSGAVLNYVDSATAGITGAMHFIGEASINISTNLTADPVISGYDFRRAKPGDVVLSGNAQEFVWTGNSWRLLGDEGSYAVKGSIKDVDIDAEANIQQSKIANLSETFDSKVDKEIGKGLSTNDFTDEEKTKLSNIEENAQTNVIEHIFLNDVEILPHNTNGLNKVVELDVKEFDDASRTKLNSIEENANVNVIEGINLNGTAQIPDNNKIVNLTINEFSTEEKNKLEHIEDQAQVNIIEHLYLNGVEVAPDQNKRVDFYISEMTQEQIEKLAGIESGAQVNIIEHIKIDGTEIYPNNNKVVEIITDPHTEHENVIEHIKINNIEQYPDNNKTINIILDQAALDLDVVAGAEIPNANGSGKDEVTQIQKKLQLERIAVTGDVKDLRQTSDTYIIFNCGSSTDVI